MTNDATEQGPTARKRRRWPWIVGGLVVLLVGLWTLGTLDPPKPKPAASPASSTVAPATTTTTTSPVSSAKSTAPPVTARVSATPRSTPPKTTAPPKATVSQTLGRKTCEILSGNGGNLYLTLTSLTAFDVSACDGYKVINADSGELETNPAYGTDVDVRCYIDPGSGTIGQALGAVLSAGDNLDRAAARDYCAAHDGSAP